MAFDPVGGSPMADGSAGNFAGGRVTAIDFIVAPLSEKKVWSTRQTHHIRRIQKFTRKF